MKFISDGMLGKLTRWLRMLGQDVVCVNDMDVSPDQEDDIILKRSDRESRIILTRDQDLYERAIKSGSEIVLLSEGDVAEQMKEITESTGKVFDLGMEDSRCSVCNGKLEKVDESAIENSVSQGVLENNENFWRCRGCGKIYWTGSHWEGMKGTIEEYKSILGDGFD